MIDYFAIFKEACHRTIKSEINFRKAKAVAEKILSLLGPIGSNQQLGVVLLALYLVLVALVDAIEKRP